MWRLDPDTPAPPHPQDFLDLKAEIESEHFQGVVRTASRLVWALGLLAVVFIPLEKVTGHKFWHELTYEEAKQHAVEVRAFRPQVQPPVDPFPEPQHGRPSERPDHPF